MSEVFGVVYHKSDTRGIAGEVYSGGVCNSGMEDCCVLDKVTVCKFRSVDVHIRDLWSFRIRDVCYIFAEIVDDSIGNTTECNVHIVVGASTDNKSVSHARIRRCGGNDAYFKFACSHFCGKFGNFRFINRYFRQLLVGVFVLIEVCGCCCAIVKADVYSSVKTCNHIFRIIYDAAFNHHFRQRVNSESAVKFRSVHGVHFDAVVRTVHGECRVACKVVAVSVHEKCGRGVCTVEDIVTRIAEEFADSGFSCSGGKTVEESKGKCLVVCLINLTASSHYCHIAATVAKKHIFHYVIVLLVKSKCSTSGKVCNWRIVVFAGLNENSVPEVFCGERVGSTVSGVEEKSGTGVIGRYKSVSGGCSVIVIPNIEAVVNLYCSDVWLERIVCCGDFFRCFSVAVGIAVVAGKDVFCESTYRSDAGKHAFHFIYVVFSLRDIHSRDTTHVHHLWIIVCGVDGFRGFCVAVGVVAV